MTKIFVEFFDFWPKYQIFRSEIFFTDSTPQNLPLCKKSASYLENLILYRFLSILVENCQFWVTPLTLDPMSWPPYDPDLSRKKFIWSEKDSWEFTGNFRSIPATIKKLFTKRSRGGRISRPPGSNRVKQHIKCGLFCQQNSLMVTWDLFNSPLNCPCTLFSLWKVPLFKYLGKSLSYGDRIYIDALMLHGQLI